MMKKLAYVVLSVAFLVLLVVIENQRAEINDLKWRIEFQQEFLDEERNLALNSRWDYAGWNYFQLGDDQVALDRYTHGKWAFACAEVVKAKDGSEEMMTPTRRYKKIATPPFLFHEFVR